MAESPSIIHRLLSVALLLMSLITSSGTSKSQQAVGVVPNWEALRAFAPNKQNGPWVAYMAGYRAPGDGGGGMFTWLPDSTNLPDNVLVFSSAAIRTGRWVRQWSGGRISPEMAGAFGDGKTDDNVAFNRLVNLSRTLGAFTIELTAGRHYYLPQQLDMSVGAPGLTIEGPSSSQRVPMAGTEHLVTRIELEATRGSTIKLGDSQTVRNILVWRHGLAEKAASLADVRQAVALWRSEDGVDKPLSVGIDAPFTDVTIEGTTVIGFHTGIHVGGSRFKLRHCLIDTAGYAVDAVGSKDTSLIEDVQARGLWSFGAAGVDALGDASYRPGTAFYIHDGSDGLQLNSIMAIGWVTGIWLAGSTKGNDWLISMLPPNLETPPNDGRPAAAIRTTGDVRRVTIIDPRIVFGGSVGLDFGHTDANSFAAANNNVSVIGGAIEVGNKAGTAIIVRGGSTGYLSGITFSGNGTTPLIVVSANSGEWTIDHPQLLGLHHDPWLVVDQTARSKLMISGVPQERQGGIVTTRSPIQDDRDLPARQ